MIYDPSSQISVKKVETIPERFNGDVDLLYEFCVVEMPMKALFQTVVGIVEPTCRRHNPIQ